MFGTTPLLIAALCGLCLGNPVGIKPLVDYGNANFYIDLVLFDVNRNLPDTIEIGDLGGPFDMTDCFFFGTENGIHRDGDATVVTVDNDAKFAATFKMTDTGIQCHYKYDIVRGEVTALTPKIDMSAGISLLIEEGQHPYLTEFRVTTLEDITTDITGLTPAFDWLAEDIVDWIVRGFEDEISYIIENTLRDIIQSTLDTLTVP